MTQTIKYDLKPLKTILDRIRRIPDRVEEFYKEKAMPIVQDAMVDAFMSHKWKAWTSSYHKWRGRAFFGHYKVWVNPTHMATVQHPPIQPEFIGRLTGSMFKAFTQGQGTFAAVRVTDMQKGDARIMFWGVDASMRGLPYVGKKDKSGFQKYRPIRIYHPIIDSLKREMTYWLLYKIVRD